MSILASLAVALGLAQAAVPTPGEMRTSVAPLVDQVKGSVVTIQSTKTIRRFVREDPFTEFFRQQLGGGSAPRVQRETEQGLGSGFVIDGQGTILTNNHVVAGAEQVRVVLADGRVLEAEVAGRDPDTDVAVVRLRRPPGDLRPVRLGNSDNVRVGDYVLAIGNPLGLGQTVTMGIVSAKNRVLDGKLGGFEDFIQTDAAINQGNSGGPLFNFQGEVIGINSAILNPATAMNVGFAIPINLARQIGMQIIQHRQISRGFLGATAEDLSPLQARRLGVSLVGGALVVVVEPNSPAAAAGLHPTDIIVEISGRQIDTEARLRRVIASMPPGSEVTIGYWRGGKRLEARTTLKENVGLRATGLKVAGVWVQPLGQEELQELGLPAALRVVAVDHKGIASGNLQDGDIIAAVDRNLATLAALRKLEERIQRGGGGRLVILRGGYPFALTLTG